MDPALSVLDRLTVCLDELSQYWYSAGPQRRRCTVSVPTRPAGRHQTVIFAARHLHASSPDGVVIAMSAEHNLKQKLECEPMPNVMVALPNIGGALCSTPQSLADAHYYRCRAVTLLKLAGVPQTNERISATRGP